MRLNKTQSAECQRLRDALESAIHEANTAIENANAAREAFEAFRCDFESEIQSYMDDKSDKWREGDSGEAHQAFCDAWGEECCDEFELLDADSLPEYPEEPEA